jgi:hypothetical protein
VSSKSWHISQENLGTNTKEAFSVLNCCRVICWNRSYYTDLYMSYSSKHWHKNRGKRSHDFRGKFSRFSKGGRSYGQQGTAACGWYISRGVVFSKSVQLYELWHGFQGRFVGDCFCVVSGFSLGWKCIVAADKSFLKLIESLSLFGLPHIGVFPGICLNL